MPLLYSSFLGGAGGAPATPFTPDDLFAGGEEGLWIDPSDASTCWQDTGATTPAGDGDTVALIQDKSGNGYDFTQATAGDRPTRRQDGSGNWYLDFNGDHMDSGAFSGDFVQPNYFCVGYKHDSPATTAQSLFDGQASGKRNYYFAASSELRMFGGGSSVTLSTSATTALQVATLVYEGDSSQAWIDGVAQANSFSGVGTNASAGLRIGRNFSGGNDFVGRLYGLVLRDTSFLDDREALESWMADKAGVTL